MEKDFFYGEKYYYENRIENNISYKFFFFDFEQELNEQLDFVLLHSIDGISIIDTTEENVKTIINFLLTNKISIKLLKLQYLSLSNVDFLDNFIDLEILTLIVEAKKEFDLSVSKFFIRFFN
jgi:hypothetical protein